MESRKDKKMLEARVGIEPTDKGFADPVVTRLSPFHSISDWQPRTILSGNPTVMKRLEGRPVVRFAEQLQLHRALDEFGWVGVIDELNEAARPKNQSMPERFLSLRTARFSLASSIGGSRFSRPGTKFTASSIRLVRLNPYGPYSLTIDHGADGMRLSVFAWR